MKIFLFALSLAFLSTSYQSSLFAKSLSGSIWLDGRIQEVRSNDNEVTVGEAKFQISDDNQEAIIANMKPVTGKDIQLRLIWGSSFEERMANLKQYLNDTDLVNAEELDCRRGGNAFLEVIDNTRFESTWGNCTTLSGF